MHRKPRKGNITKGRHTKIIRVFFSGQLKTYSWLMKIAVTCLHTVQIQTCLSSGKRNRQCFMQLKRWVKQIQNFLKKYSDKKVVIPNTGRPWKMVWISWLWQYYILSIYPSVDKQLMRTLFEAHIVTLFDKFPSPIYIISRQ